MRWIWWSIHQHKPRTMYVGPTPMLNHCRLSGSEFTLPPFSLWCSWGIWSKSAARASIHSESFLNWLFGSSWSVMAALARKNNPAGKQCRLSFCVSYSFLSSLAHPFPPQQGQHDLCTRSRDPWKLQKAARGNIWTFLMGEWRCGSEAGMTGAWWKCCKAICSASVMTGGGVRRRQVSIRDLTVSPRMVAPQLWLCMKLPPLIQPWTSDPCLGNHLFDCFIPF